LYKEDYEGLRYVTQHTTVPVAADESASGLLPLLVCWQWGAVNVVNIKLMKAGIVEALDIAALCRVSHTPLMIGAMIESRLANQLPLPTLPLAWVVSAILIWTHPC